MNMRNRGKIVVAVIVLWAGIMFAQDMGHLIPAFSSSITSVGLENGKLVVEYRRPSSMRYTIDPYGYQPSGEVWRDIYCASNGVIVFERRVNGKIIPRQVTPERIEWSEEVPKESLKWVTPTNYTLTTTNCFIEVTSNVVTTVREVNL